MKLRSLDHKNTAGQSRTAGRTPSRRLTLGIAALLISTGVFSSAVTVAAAREPGSPAAYGPPSSPESVRVVRTQNEVAPAPRLKADKAKGVVPGATSSAVESPLTIASSWTMSPLPEGEGGTVTSSTEQTPVTSSGSIVASPQ